MQTLGERVSETRLEQLRKRRDALNARINAVKARERTVERRRETRRKVLAGAAVLYKAEKDVSFAAELNALLDGFLTREDERALFALRSASPEKIDECDSG